MGGPTGAMSTKLVLKAGMLLFAARLDGHSATATIDAGAAETVIAPDLAAHLRLSSGEADQEIGHFHVIGVDHAELRLRRVLVRAVPGPAKIVIGQDLLARMRIRLDFGQGRLRLLDGSDGVRMGPGDASIPVSGLGGCLALQIPNAPKPVVLASVVDDSALQPSATLLQAGGVQLPAFDGAALAKCGRDADVVTWASFRALRVIFDMPHGRMIVSGRH